MTSTYGATPTSPDRTLERPLPCATTADGAFARERLLSIAVVLLFVFSSFAILASTVSASGSDGDASASDTLDDVRTRLSSSCWDWESMVDESGTVGVIVFLTDSTYDVSALDRATALMVPGDQAHKATMASSLRQFGHSLDGFSATLDVATIEAIASSEPGLTVYPDLTVNATFVDGVTQIGADQIWTMTDSHGFPVTGTGIVVAVIDTGIDYDHPDLGGGIGTGYKVLGGYDFVNDDDDPMDDNGHGTHVAGTIAADGDIVGVAPGANLLAYKALGADGSGSMSDVIEAIDAAMDPNGDGSTSDHADIISMSLGGEGEVDDPVCQAVEAATAAGVTVVVAAGNSGPSMGTVSTPGLAESAITVGAVDGDGSLASFSSRGPTAQMAVKPEVSAPGVDILSTFPGSDYSVMSGTSMATPHVSGAAALLLQMHPDWTPEMLKSAIVSEAKAITESLWTAGSGQVWLPTAIGATMFASSPLVSYGLSGGSSVTLDVINSGTASTFSVSSSDIFSLLPNGTLPGTAWENASSVSPTSAYIAHDGSSTVTLTVSQVPTDSEEGYYAGRIVLTSAAGDISIPFGYAVMSILEVHVYDMAGEEVFDPFGGVWVYDLPDAAFVAGLRGYIAPVPPATFFLPSGYYSVHAIGHQLLYTFDDAYVLSGTVSVGRMDTVTLDLLMADAHELTMDMETEDGLPVYVKEYRVYCRHEGVRNISFDLTGSDYTVAGPEVFTLPTSHQVYVSDTDAQVGISYTGFAYTPAMWEFMQLNWEHWYEYITGTSTDFMVEASADLQYLLAWEFDGIDSSVPSLLTWDESTSAVFETTYDIPGTISNPWCNWGTHRAMGGDATFFVRRDTDTSLNPFFSGMTRTTVVSGTFTELYFPRSVFGGYSEREYYIADYDHLIESSSSSDILVPDRNYITTLEPTYELGSIGAGPFYPSLYTENSGTELVLFHPLLMDQSGARVGGQYVPSMYLYKNGGLAGIYQLSEYLARPDAVRVVDLFGDGTYVAKMDYTPTSQISGSVHLELGFKTPASDLDPPRVTGMTMSQRFVPGATVPITIEAVDSVSSVTLALSWRAGASDSWKSLTTSKVGDSYSASIPTTVSTATVDLLLTVTDASSNFLSATITTAAMAEVPVDFELAPQDDAVEYRDASVPVVLEGLLKDASGNPLSTTAGVPLELWVGGEKVAMVLDEYVSGTTHTHDGNILFEWRLNPTSLFTGLGQTVTVTVSFDLGVYEPVTRTFTLTSVESVAVAPEIALLSPEDASVFMPGETIDLAIVDDGSVDVQYSLDDGQYTSLASPWDISTSAWADGVHTLDVSVEDDDGFTVTASYSFDVDAAYPVVSIVQPAFGSTVPLGSEMEIHASDRHLVEVSYSLDGGESIVAPSPYIVDMTGWAAGGHYVQVVAEDVVGHESEAMSIFTISESSVTAYLVSPADGSFVTSGTPIVLSVMGAGDLVCTWSEGGAPTVLEEPYEISTSGWDEGAHVIEVNVTDSEDGWFELSFTMNIDDTVPVISVLSPTPGSYVTLDSIVSFQASDANLAWVNWSVLGIGQGTESQTFTLSLSFMDQEGLFAITIRATDLAGNAAEESFAFVMDAYLPSVGFAGVSSGESILPGEPLQIVAADSYLDDVTLSVDGSTPLFAYSGMTFDTRSISLGWHELTLVATDLAGHVDTEAVSIYVDGTPPELAMAESFEFVYGESLTVSAEASDDFGVAAATLFYEVDGEGFASVQMDVSSGGLVGVIPEAALWDGMELYVSVEDHAGNSVTGDLVTASMVASAGGDDPSGGISSSFLSMLAVAGSAAAGAILILFVLSRRHETSARSARPASHSASGKGGAAQSPKALRQARPEEMLAGPRGVPARAAAVHAEPRPAPRKAASVHIATAAVAASVPRMVAPAKVSEPEAETLEDYGELIERELVDAMTRMSIYREPSTLSARVSGDYAPEEVKIINALKLKKLMDGDLSDDSLL